ncbi:MAG: hypothetical protein ACREA7_08655 [Nitrosotalea sp.]
MKTLHLAIIVIAVTGAISVVFVLFFVPTITNKNSEFFSTIQPIQSDNNTRINANGGRPLDITMHVNETETNGQAISIPNLPITLKDGENTTLKIEIASRVPEPLSLQFRVFNDVGNYPDMAFARVKFNGDVSGLPNGLIASFGKNVVAVNANGSDQDTLTFTVGQTTKTGNYKIGVLGLATISSSAGIQIGDSQILWIPITIK